MNLSKRYFDKMNYKQLRPLLDKIEKANGLNRDSLNTLYSLVLHGEWSVRLQVVLITVKKIKESNAWRQELLPLLMISLSNKDFRYLALEGLIYYPKNKELSYLVGNILLMDKDPYTRAEAADVIRFSDRRISIPFLERALTDKHPMVLAYSSGSLGLLNSKGSIPLLCKLQAKNKNTLVKVGCWGALLLLTRDKKWLAKMLEKFSRNNYAVRWHIIAEVENAVEKGIISGSEAVPVYIRNLSSVKKMSLGQYKTIKKFIEEYR